MSDILVSLERGLRMLLLFTTARPEWTIANMAEALDMPAPTAYRVANTLLGEGLLERTRSRGPLRLSMRVARLGWIAQESHDLRQIVHPHLKSMVAETGQTAVFMVPQSTGAACIDRVEGTAPIRPTTLLVGEQVSYNAGAHPLLLLAYLPPDEVTRILAGPLEKLTPYTPTDPRVILERCRAIREKGLSFTVNEAVVGAVAIAGPLYGVGDKLLGAVGFTGIIGDVTLEEHGPIVAKAGQEISRELGAGHHLGVEL